MTESRGDKARADARWEAEAEYRETMAEQKAMRLLYCVCVDGCPCEIEQRLRETCRDKCGWMP